MCPDVMAFRPPALAQSSPTTAPGGTSAVAGAVPAQASAQPTAPAAVHAAAHAAGYAAGYAAGARAAAEEATTLRLRLLAEHDRAEGIRDGILGQALGLLEQAVDAMRQAGTPVVADARATLHAAALELASAVLGHELAADGARLVLDRVLALPSDLGTHTVRLHPADLARLREALAETSHRLPDGVALVADASLTPGDVVAEHPTGHLDGTIRSALGRAAAALEIRADAALEVRP